MIPNVIKFAGGGLVGMLLTIGILSGSGTARETVLPPDTGPVPKAIAGDVKCPKPPRTGGAIFVVYGKGTVTKENPDGAGLNAVVETLNCDYNAEWSYTVDADGKEVLQNYAGPGAIPAPRVFSTTLEINRVLADLQ